MTDTTATEATETITIRNRWTGAVAFSLDVQASLPFGVKIGLAVKAAFKSDAVLRGADLSGADLRDADLRDADLRGAVLRDADLRDADLRGAVLRGADLSGADLSGADLSGADLRDADLRDADLRGAVLSGAVLRDANLSDAVLRGADLSGAVLRDANLSGADLRGADLPPLAAARLSIVPEVGSYVGWKKCRDGVIVKLLIPEGARRSNATGRKCRAEFAEVLEVIGADEAVSLHGGATKYKAGETVRADHWDENRWEECSGGIHHYLSRIEAEHH